MIDGKGMLPRVRTALGRLDAHRAGALDVALRGGPMTAWQTLVRWTNPIREFADAPDATCLRRARVGLLCALIVGITALLAELTALACLAWYWCE